MSFGFGGGKVADIWAELDLKDQAYNRKIQKAKKSSVSAGASMRKAFTGIALTVGVAGVARGFTSIIRDSSEAEETINRFNKVFGTSANEVRAWSDVVVNRFGASKTASLDLLASFQDFFVPLGASRREAAKLSIQMVKLAGDLGSFRNLSSTESTPLLQSFLLGETRAGRRLGIAVNQMALLNKITEQTGKTNIKNVSEMEKIIARIALATDASKDALGDFERTQFSLANSSRRTKSAWDDFTNSLGDSARKILPVDDSIRALGNAFTFLSEALDKLNEPEKEAALRGGLGGFIDVRATEDDIDSLMTDLDAVKAARIAEENRLRGRRVSDALARLAEKPKVEEVIDKRQPARPSVDFSDPREFLRIAQEAATGTKDPAVKEQRKTNSILEKTLNEEKVQTQHIIAFGVIGP